MDRYLAEFNAELAAKVQVIPGLDVRLGFIDVAAREDMYHVMQGLKDPTLAGNPNCCYFWERSGAQGTRGETKLEGPEPQTSVAKRIAQKFKEKTGADWGSVKEGDRGLPGKYFLQSHGTPDLTAKWEYYVSDGVDGKRTGWYPYESNASDEVEEIYAQHIADDRDSRTSTRVISSGYFQYEVDLTKMTQMNTRTRKVRTIRRSAGTDSGSTRNPERRAMKKIAAPPMRSASMKVLKRSASMKVLKRSSSMKKLRVTGGRSMKVLKAAGVMKKAPMKVVKVMKAKKKVSKIGSKRQVLKGAKVKTSGGLKSTDLMKNKKGKIVSKKRHVRGKEVYARLAPWNAAFKKARAELGLTGFVKIKKGSEFYNRTKALMSA